MISIISLGFASFSSKTHLFFTFTDYFSFRANTWSSPNFFLPFFAGDFETAFFLLGLSPSAFSPPVSPTSPPSSFSSPASSAAASSFSPPASPSYLYTSCSLSTTPSSAPSVFPFISSFGYSLSLSLPHNPFLSLPFSLHPTASFLFQLPPPSFSCPSAPSLPPLLSFPFLLFHLLLALPPTPSPYQPYPPCRHATWPRQINNVPTIYKQYKYVAKMSQFKAENLFYCLQYKSQHICLVLL